MDLEIQRKPALGQTLDELRLEHRPVAIEQLFVRASHVRQKLRLCRTAWQYRVLNVICHVDVLGVDPSRQMRQAELRYPVERRPRRGLAVRCRELGDKVLAGVLRRLQQNQSGDMLWIGLALGQKEHQVEQRYGLGHGTNTPLRLAAVEWNAV